MQGLSYTRGYTSPFLVFATFAISILLSSFLSLDSLVDGSLDKPYSSPATIPTKIKNHVFPVTLPLKKITPSMANTTLFPAPTTQYVVADVFSIHHMALIDNITPIAPVQSTKTLNIKCENASC